MAVIGMDVAVFRGAVNVTAAFLGLYAGCITYQAVTKYRLLRSAKLAKEKFDRYADPRMLPADRLVGNFLEWMVPFLAVFWMSMAASNGETEWLGWGYVASRALFAPLAVNGGIRRAGITKRILFATVPAYACLIWMLFECFV